MRTYSKRHRDFTKSRADHGVALEASIDNYSGRKRLNASRTKDNPSKRRKSESAQSTMDAVSFVTPHPTKEAQDQAYKLPSTKPMPSPYPFSPVPLKIHEQPLDNRTSQRSVPLMASTYLKENDRSNIRPLRHSSKTLSSFTLTSGSGPLSSHHKGYNKKRSKSQNLATHYQSTSNSMPFNSTSPQDSNHERPAKPKSIVDQFSRSTATDGDRQSLQNPSLRSNAHSKITRPKIHYPTLNQTEQTLLASPFASRASSPVAPESVASRKADRDGNPRSGLFAPTPVRKRGQGLIEVYIDLNTLSRSSRQSERVKKERNRQSSSAFNSPEKPGRAMPLSSELFCGKIRPGNENNNPWKDRRPSAPSSLQRPPKHVAKARVPSRMAKKAEPKSDEGDKARKQKRSSFRASHAQPLEDIQVFDDDLEFDLIDNHDPISWMLPHSTDFNRPPSQMSMVGEFLSSVENRDEGDEGTTKRGDGVDHNCPEDGFESAWVTSTPFKEVLARKQSFPTKDVVPDLLQGKDDAIVDKKPLYRDFGQEKDAELTASLEGGDDAEINESDHHLQDHTPWITDSIISPPAEYLQMKGKEADVALIRRGDEGDMLFHVAPAQITEQNVNSSSRFSNAESSSYASGNVGNPDLAIQVGRMVDDQEGGHSRDVDAAVTVDPRRTCSGALLASQPETGTLLRRTRTGTIVGLSSTTIGRTRSGTITLNGSSLEQPLPLAGVRRTRNGTIIGPLPDLTRSGSGALKKLDYFTRIPPRETDSPDEVRRDDVQGDPNSVGSTTTSPSRLGEAESELEWTLEEVEEVEFYADSLYVPRLVSSPDPIDFLRFGNAKEEMGATDGVLASNPIGGGPVNELQWCVADEPPSPEVTRKTCYTPGGGRTGKGILADRARPSRRGKAKGKEKRLTRFMGAHGQVENLTREDDSALHFGDGVTDDELLLVEGQSLALFC